MNRYAVLMSTAQSKQAEGVSVSGGPGKHQVSDGVNIGSYEKSRNMCELKLFRVND